MASGGPLLHPIRYWRQWLVLFGVSAAMAYGAQPVADATGHSAFVPAYMGVVGVLGAVGLRWANRRVPVRAGPSSR